MFIKDATGMYKQKALSIEYRESQIDAVLEGKHKTALIDTTLNKFSAKNNKIGRQESKTPSQ